MCVCVASLAYRGERINPVIDCSELAISQYHNYFSHFQKWLPDLSLMRGPNYQHSACEADAGEISYRGFSIYQIFQAKTHFSTLIAERLKCHKAAETKALSNTPATRSLCSRTCVYRKKCVIRRSVWFWSAISDSKLIKKGVSGAAIWREMARQSLLCENTASSQICSHGKISGRHKNDIDTHSM